VGQRQPGRPACGSLQHFCNKSHHQRRRNHPPLEQKRKQNQKRPATAPPTPTIGTKHPLAPDLPSRAPLPSITEPRPIKNKETDLKATGTGLQLKGLVEADETTAITDINSRRVHAPRFGDPLPFQPVPN
jgi:hypothetical protein